MSEAIVIGFVCGIIAVVVLFKLLAKKLMLDGKTKTKYDERQLIEQGRGYRCAFLAVVIYCCLFFILDMLFEVQIRVGIIMICGILVASATHIIYCIFHEAYWGLNNNTKNYIIFLVIVSGLNLAIGIVNGINRNFYTEGALSYSIINLIIAIFMAVILVTMLIKWVRDKREVE